MLPQGICAMTDAIQEDSSQYFPKIESSVEVSKNEKKMVEKVSLKFSAQNMITV